MSTKKSHFMTQKQLVPHCFITNAALNQFENVFHFRLVWCIRWRNSSHQQWVIEVHNRLVVLEVYDSRDFAKPSKCPYAGLVAFSLRRKIKWCESVIVWALKHIINDQVTSARFASGIKLCSILFLLLFQDISHSTISKSVSSLLIRQKLPAKLFQGNASEFCR